MVSRKQLRHGLTLIEVLLSMGLLSLIITIAYMTFSTAVRSWRAGTRLADHLSHADHSIEQVVMALRSSYYADTGAVAPRYGFVHEADSVDGLPADVISWVKLGGALVGGDPSLAETPHRVEVFIQSRHDPWDGWGYGLAVRAWRIDIQEDDFDPEELEPVFVSPRILGLQCRMADPDDADDVEPGEIEWLDEWEDRFIDRLPRAVELTLFVEPAQAGKPPIEIKRIIEIPMSEISWNPIRRSTPTERVRRPARGTPTQTDSSAPARARARAQQAPQGPPPTRSQ